MKRVLQAGAALVALSAMNAWATQADAAIYGKVSLGQSGGEIEGVTLDDGTAYGAALGTSLGPVRVEAGVDHISGSINFGPTISAEALDYHATAYLDLPVGEHASLFAGAGLDYVDGQASFFGTDIEASGDGWHWAAGGAYRLNDRMIAEAQYRHVSADLDADFVGAVNLDADVVTLGLRLAL